MENQFAILVVVVFAMAYIMESIFVAMEVKGSIKAGHILRDQIARNKFSNVRRKLYGLASGGKISFDDREYRSLYNILTTFMKAKGNYTELSKVLKSLHYMRDPDSEVDEVKDQYKKLSEEPYRELVLETYIALEYVAFNFNRLDRTLVWVYEKLERMLQSNNWILKLLVTKNTVQKVEFKHEFEKIQSNFKHSGVLA